VGTSASWIERYCLAEERSSRLLLDLLQGGGERLIGTSWR